MRLSIIHKIITHMKQFKKPTKGGIFEVTQNFESPNFLRRVFQLFLEPNIRILS